MDPVPPAPPISTPPVAPQPQPVVQPPQSKSKTWKLIMGGILLLGVGIVGGVFLGKQLYSQPLSPPAPSPTVEVTPSPASDTITSTPTVNPSPIVVPASWKVKSATDSYFGLTTSLTLPPDYSFHFSGSETTLSSSTESSDSWDYLTSLSTNSNNQIYNSYDGSSRRTWYEKLLEGNDTVKGYANTQTISVKEVPVNDTSFLAITIKWDLGTETHYIIVNNGILHIFRPLTEAAKANHTFFSQNAPIILSTLTSSWTKP
ncbi:MAG: hypothetical protein Q7S31_03895 [bacterium]|nr:hypothetical protein [bacterium]